MSSSIFAKAKKRTRGQLKKFVPYAADAAEINSLRCMVRFEAPLSHLSHRCTDYNTIGKGVHVKWC